MADINIEDLTTDQIRGVIASRAHPPHIVHHLERYTALRSPESTSSNATYASPPGVASDESHVSSGHARFDFTFPFTKLAQQRNKDGEKPKRRGPKPDSKPALTRRQELNRQAQRTHRERKERYVKSLEEEVIRLRETFGIITKEKTQILEENRKLKNILAAHGIAYDPYVEYTATHAQKPDIQTSPQSRLNMHEQIGIDFVLALERPCMHHMKFLTNGTVNDPESEFHGHALMLSCPPEYHNMQNPETDWGLKTYDLPGADLVRLFNLSHSLPVDGEMPPIAVWAKIAGLKQFDELEVNDFEQLKQELLPNVTCHGFGAVIDTEFVDAALERLLASRFGISC